MADIAPKPDPAGHGPPRWFGFAHLVVFGAGIGFFVLSVVALGVLPGMRLQQDMDSKVGAAMPGYSDAELRGRRTYVSLGCALCHSQQVRFLPSDVRRWGTPTQAWETRNDVPQLWGTRRIGPDLARETGVRSNDWQLTHLYKPQWVVPDSVMPSFAWLFEGSPARPTAAATDLLAYLNTLGRARQSGAGTGSSLQGDASMDPSMLMEIANLCSTPFVNPSQALVDAATIDSLKLPANVPAAELGARGSRLFDQNCSGCHGVTGDGAGPAAAGLSPKPANLRATRYSIPAIATALWNGVAGTSMPAWREFSATDLASLVKHIQGLNGRVVEADAAPSTAALARGATVYAVNCVSCHGVDGDGNGPAATALLPRPANFTIKQPDAAQVQRALVDGVLGTAMPPWPGLSVMERQAVTAFVRSLYVKSSEAAR